MTYSKGRWPASRIRRFLRNALGPERSRVLRQRLRRLSRPAWLGIRRRTAPVSAEWGLDRGTPIDRYYVARFLEEHRRDIAGRVLEIRDRRYTERYGGRVTQADVLDIDPTNPLATIVADLSDAGDVPSDCFDCIILTQTLQFIFDVQGAIAHTHRMLRPGGVALVTVPSVSRVAPRYGLETDHWRFTEAACRELFGRAFGRSGVEVRSYGNVLAGVAFLMGLAAEEMPRRRLDHGDRLFPLVVTVRAAKQPALRDVP